MKLSNLFRRTKAAPKDLSPVSQNGQGWINIIREPFTGAWQRNISISTDTALTFSAVFRCISLISSDVSKMRMRLVRRTESGAWEETESPAFSPILRKPNNWQTRQQFYANWVESKLVHGNTYVLKERDGRGVVVRLYVLDPCRVTVLVAPDSSIFYEVRSDHLSGVAATSTKIPQSEIIHDRFNTFYHPLLGLSPLTACNLAVAQGLAMQRQQTAFFARDAKPGGILTAPGEINDLMAMRLKEEWETSFSGENVGRTAVLGSGIDYKPMVITPEDAQLVDQLKMSAQTVASVFGVPAFMIGGDMPTYDNTESLALQYYTQCLQPFIEAIEALLDEGLGLGPAFGNSFGSEFDLTDLLRMDSKSRAQSAREAIQAGMSPDEVRHHYFDLPPTPGGDTPYLQEQCWPLAQLAARPLPGREITEADPMPAEPMPTEPMPADMEEERRLRTLRQATRALHQLAEQEMQNAWLN
jgi:HK97 family phage portal protein